MKLTALTLMAAIAATGANADFTAIKHDKGIWIIDGETGDVKWCLLTSPTEGLSKVLCTEFSKQPPEDADA